jgi:hypothetical protein
MDQQAEHDAELLRRRTWAAKVDRARFFNRLRELFSYDPETGIFTRLVSTSNNARAGGVAGSMSYGYLQIRIGKRLYQAHRLAFLYMTGIWPPHEIDHINLDRADNRWINLRMATHTQNVCNVPVRKHNMSGVKGAAWRPSMRKFVAQISIDGKTRYLGIRNTSEEAAALYAAAAERHFGEFARIE